MTRRKASFLQGTTAAPYLLPAEDHRLNHAGLWVPSSVPGAAPLAVQSGVVWGPGNPGNVTIVAGGVSVSPFHAAIQGSKSGVQGVFELTSDADEFRAITAASSTQYRRGRLGVRIYDQLNGAAQDTWDIEVLYGAAAASAGAALLPPLPTDSTWFELRQFAVDNAGAITLSGLTPRTMPRGAILPVDPLDVTPGAYLGQYRDHADLGLQRWDGAQWGPFATPPRQLANEAAAANIPTAQRQLGMRVWSVATAALGIWDGTIWVWFDTKWQAWTPQLAVGNTTTYITLGNASVDCATFRAGRKVDIRGVIKFGTTTSWNGLTGVYYMAPPPGLAPKALPVAMYANFGSSQIIGFGSNPHGFTAINVDGSGTAALRRIVFYHAGGLGALTTTNANYGVDRSGHVIQFQATYETAFEA